jgi:hypothetical protein
MQTAALTIKDCFTMIATSVTFPTEHYFNLKFLATESCLAEHKKQREPATAGICQISKQA